MRGEVCVGSASFLSFAALVLLIFVHVGQINTSTVPRGVSLAKVNVSQYGEALHTALIDDIDALYTNNASAPLQSRAGLRQFYSFGLYSHCAYVNNTAGACTNTTFQRPFKPYDAITSDMLPNYTDITNFILSDTTFADSGYLGQSSKAAYWMLLIGTICAVLALLTGVAKHNVTFFVSTAFALLGSLFILIGAAIWTVLIKKAEMVNSILIGSNGTSVLLGIFVSASSGLYMIWAAFACLFVSIVPYMISCCTYRG